MRLCRLALVFTFASAMAVLVSVPGRAQTAATLLPKLRAAEKAALKARPFDLTEVRLLDGPFKRSMELHARYLLEFDPDRFLAKFRENAGLKPKAQVYGGWESLGVAGHTLGHYLSGCAMIYASTGDRRFLDRANYIVDELAECQAANGSGYVAAIPDGKRVFAEVAAGNIRSAGFDLNGCWVPWYTMHKLFAGLRDAYLHCGNDKARSVLVKLADWAEQTTKNLSDEQFQRMLDCEQGGMNEVLADVYAMTGDARYLRLSQRFNHRAVLDPLSAREDRLDGLHANTNIPKIIGAVRDYELTGDRPLLTAASTFWNSVVRDRSFANGGNATDEFLWAKAQLSKSVGPRTSESCGTYNMLKLTRRLFCLDPKAEYADFYERALYNHILATQNPMTGRITYFFPLKTGCTRSYCENFECCVGTGFENPAKYNDSIYFHDGAQTLYVNLFIASALNWKSSGVKIIQQTGFPDEAGSRLTVICRKPAEFTMKIRHPYWATSGIQISVNGKKLRVVSAPGSYAAVKRVWKDGDIVTVSMPMSFHTEGFRDNGRVVAIAYGPMVMCAHLNLGDTAPVIVCDDDNIASAIKPVGWAPMTFSLSPLVLRKLDGGKVGDVSLVPLCREHRDSYIVYWDRFTQAQWTEQEAARRAELARQKEMEAYMTDEMRFEMQPERDHNLQGEKTFAGDAASESGIRRWRAAGDGGWFSFEMKTDPDAPLELLCTYWGSDFGSREFDILIDGRKIAEQKLENDKPGYYFDVAYPIPEDLTSGKDKVTVKVQAHPGKTAGGVFGCRMMRRR